MLPACTAGLMNTKEMRREGAKATLTTVAKKKTTLKSKHSQTHPLSRSKYVFFFCEDSFALLFFHYLCLLGEIVNIKRFTESLLS